MDGENLNFLTERLIYIHYGQAIRIPFCVLGMREFGKSLNTENGRRSDRSVIETEKVNMYIISDISDIILTHRGVETVMRSEHVN